MRILIALTSTLLTSPAWAGPELSLAYHGDFLTHPGLAGRAALPLAGGPRARLQWEAEAGAWWHPKNMLPVYVRTGPAVRLEGPRRGTWGAFAHVGAAEGFLAARTYAVVDGEVETQTLPARPFGVVAGGLELGRSTPRAPFDGWFVRPQVGLRFPTFHGYGVDLAVQVGARLGGAR